MDNEPKILATILSGVVGIPITRHEVVVVQPTLGPAERSFQAMQQAKGGLLPEGELKSMRALQARQRASHNF